MGMIHDLLGTLPSTTVRKDPAQFLLLAMITPLSAGWAVGNDDDILQITVGNTSASIDLTPLTVNGLQSALGAVGLSLSTNAWPNGSATLLVPGQSGSAVAGTPVRLYGHASPLWSILRPYDRELRLARASKNTHAEQLILTGTQLYWVDYWGSYFGVPRRSGEQDSPYIQRIIAEVFRARNTKLSIEKGILNSLGWDVYIKETWRRMFALSSRSKLSGRDHLPGDYYRYHIIHPLSEQNVDWDLVEEQIHLLRPAGTVMWTPSNYGKPNDIPVNLPADLQGNTHGLAQGWMDLASGRLSRNLTLSLDYLFLRPTGSAVRVHETPASRRVFYGETGDPSWDDTTWTSQGTKTWREKSAVSSPTLAKYQGIPDAICEFHSMAVVAGNGLWSATGYFPEIFTGDPLVDRAELHAAALSFGDFS